VNTIKVSSSIGPQGRSTSQLEKKLRPMPQLTISNIIQAFPGCKRLYVGPYRNVLDTVGPTLQVCQPQKFAAIARTFAEDSHISAQLSDYMLTEYWGGRFIEEFLQRNPHHPQIMLMTRHANDEKRHADLFGALAGTRVVDTEGSAAFQLEERFHRVYARCVKDDFFAMACLLHGFEVRSALIQSYWFTLMDLFPHAPAAALRPTFSRIATDEVFHVTYTMQMVCQGLAAGADPSVLANALRLAEASIEVVEAMPGGLATLSMCSKTPQSCS